MTKIGQTEALGGVQDFQDNASDFAKIMQEMKSSNMAANTQPLSNQSDLGSQAADIGGTVQLNEVKQQLGELANTINKILLTLTQLVEQIQSLVAAKTAGGSMDGMANRSPSDMEMSSMMQVTMMAKGSMTEMDGRNSNDAPGSIADIASGSDDFNILTKALETAGLTDAVATGDDLTVFAPTDEAFGKLAQDLGYKGDIKNEGEVFDFLVGALTELGNGDPIGPLTDILLYHVSSGVKSEGALGKGGDVKTLLETDDGPATIAPRLNADGTVSLGDKDPDVEDPRIVAPDVAASNGKIQGIDRVLLPLDL